VNLAWSEGLSVGNATIDSEHQKLLQMINDVENAIRAKDRSNLPDLFKELEAYVSLHFSDEEKIARAIKFDFANNKHDRDTCINPRARRLERNSAQ
jgi:hemerythrin